MIAHRLVWNPTTNEAVVNFFPGDPPLTTKGVEPTPQAWWRDEVDKTKKDMGGFFPVLFSFAVGTGVGVYVAQNYRVPNVQWWLQQTTDIVRRMERQARKSQEEK